MVCCTLIAALFGLICAPFLRRKGNPLAWRGEARAGGRIKRRLRSFGYAFAGIGFVIRHEANMRIHLAASLIVIGLGLYCQISPTDWRWLALAIGLVLAAETMNTAIEQACNALGGKPDAAIGAAKDAAAGAVLLCALTAAFIGASVFWPYLGQRWCSG